jgi:hypothetical protein
MDITDPETGKKLRSALAPLYVSKSQEGYRLHFGGTTAESRLQFCEGDVVGWKDISISFVIGDAATGTAGEYTATGKMLFTQNPGVWKFIGQCEGGLKEPAEGAAPEGSEAPEPGT